MILALASGLIMPMLLSLSSSAASTLTVSAVRWRLVLTIEQGDKIPTLKELISKQTSLCKGSSTDPQDAMSLGAQFKAINTNGNTIGLGVISKTYSQSSNFYWSTDYAPDNGFNIYTNCVFEGKIANLRAGEFFEICFSWVCTKEFDRRTVAKSGWILKINDNPRISITRVNFTTQSLASKIKADKMAISKTAPGVGKKCVPNASCLIGSTGPAGGIVFFDAERKQTWGRYLEFAPVGWSGSANDPSKYWCVELGGLVNRSLINATGNEIGEGKVNTQLILNFGCSSGAAVSASSYSGGEKNDWFLPSSKELNELCKYARSQLTGDTSVECDSSGILRVGFSKYSYMSSSEISSQLSLLQSFTTGWSSESDKASGGAVRPIRSF